jgi:hypothetical protein
MKDEGEGELKKRNPFAQQHNHHRSTGASFTRENGKGRGSAGSPQRKRSLTSDLNSRHSLATAVNVWRRLNCVLMILVHIHFGVRPLALQARCAYLSVWHLKQIPQ